MDDETMSQEVAFIGNDKQEETFKFDEEIGADNELDSANTEDKQDTVAEPEEEEDKRVPYSRFKKINDELEERDSIISDLEARLSSLETKRTESNEEVIVPPEWVELYGDSDVSKRAYKIQLQREEQIQENAVRIALEQYRNELAQNEQAIEQNEGILDEKLDDLQASIGKKLTSRQEEDILSIVDEFSPVGSDGKYLSLFPFDKAYEIYQLRNQNTIAKTANARSQVAGLTGNSSEGDSDSSGSSFKRGWDSWREAL